MMQTFFLIYSLVILGYFAALYYLILLSPRRNYKEVYSPFTVIIPCYNEEYDYLKKCVDSIVNAEGDKQIILVDNNSNLDGALKAIEEYKKNGGVLVLEEKRQGKRFAHSKGLQYAKCDIVVFVDSDTIVLKNSLLELIKPMQDKKIGAVCGNIRIKNKDDNLLTKSLNAMYWNSFEYYRRAVSSIGFLYVCSGALACYRKEFLLALEDEYLNQTFMGRRCSISDDTFMTVRIQSRFGKKIAFQPRALGLTYSPNTVRGFWKQLFRWRQGFLREGILMWKEPKKNIKLLFLDTQFNMVTQTVMSFFKIFLLVNLIIYFSFYEVLMFLLWFALISSIHSVYLYVYNPRAILNIFVYSFLYEFIFMFTYFHALVRINEQGKWSTR